MPGYLTSKHVTNKTEALPLQNLNLLMLFLQMTQLGVSRCHVLVLSVALNINEKMNVYFIRFSFLSYEMQLRPLTMMCGLTALKGVALMTGRIL